MKASRAAVAACVAALTLSPIPSQAAWTTYHLDNGRSANDTTEPAATTVSSAWTSTALDGQVFAEPLIVGNTVLVATENSTVYALDGENDDVLWQNHLGAPVAASSLPCGNIDPVGITSTPVVDTTAGVLYAVGNMAQPGIHYQLFALDLNNGGNLLWQETLTVNGFDATTQGQRGALILSQGRVYVPFGGRAGDCGTYGGRFMAEQTSGPGHLLSFLLPGGPNAGGIWAASGPAADASGNVYVSTGNTFCGSGCAYDYSEAVIKLSPTLGLLDYFAPTNWASLNASDTDLGSLGPALLTPSLIFQAGKSGDGFLISTGPMGHIGGELFTAHVCPGLTSDAAFGGSAYAPPYLYVPCRNNLVVLTVNTSSPSFAFAHSGPNVSFSGPPIVAGGLVWTIDPAGTVYGLDPVTLATRFTANIGFANHFATPSAANGRLFVPAGTHIDAFSLVPMPAVKLSPRSLSFGNRSVGTTSPAQISTLNNVGNAPLTITNIVARGDFAQTNTCGTLPVTVAAGTSCNISVTFTPTASGVRTGAVTITDNSTGSPQTLSLTGYSLPFKGAYTLDGWGGLHPIVGSAAMSGGAYWPNWKIARSVALLADASGGYTLDGYGGLHAFGSASAASGAPYWGWDIGRDVVLLPTSTAASASGYVLDGWGGLHPFGGAPAVQGGVYWPNWDIAKRAVLLSDGTGGYVLDGWGGLHPFAVGSAAMPPAISNNTYWQGWNIARDVSLTPGSTAANVSGVTLDGYGGVHPFGGAGAITGRSAYWLNWDIARAIKLSPASTAANPQGWVLDGWGGLHAFGSAPALPAGVYWPNWDIAVQLTIQWRPGLRVISRLHDDVTRRLKELVTIG